MSFQNCDRRVIIELNYNLVMQSIQAACFHPALNSTHFFDIFNFVGFNVPHAEYISLVDYQTAYPFIQDCRLDVARLHKHETQ